MIPSDLPAWKDTWIRIICTKILSLIRFDLLNDSIHAFMLNNKH